MRIRIEVEGLPVVDCDLMTMLRLWALAGGNKAIRALPGANDRVRVRAWARGADDGEKPAIDEEWTEPEYDGDDYD